MQWTGWPSIALGTWNYRGGTAPLVRGVELGLCFLDTAEVYNTEHVVGNVVREVGRNNVIVATKVSSKHHRYDDVLWAAERSLGNLGIDCIDLYQLHGPSNDIPFAETMRAMEHLADSGMISRIGVSNFTTAQLEAAIKVMRNYPITSNQVQYSLADRTVENDLLSFCNDCNVLLIAYSPLNKGRLLDHSVVDYIAREVGKTPAQVALNYCIGNNAIALPKSERVERVEEFAGALGWSLTEDQRRHLCNGIPTK